MLIFIKMIGAISLLILGTHTVKTAMLTTFGESLRNWLSKVLTDKFRGYFSGCLIAMMLQSSTATALLVSGLQSEGLITTGIALSSVLGADLGSSIMVRVLSLDLSALAPVLLSAGVALKLLKNGTKKGDFGGVLIGLGLIMTALSGIMETTAPLKSSPQIAETFSLLADSPHLAMGAGFVMTLLCFSSLAVVVITAGLVASGALVIEAGLWFALGADFGSACLALFTTLAASSVARRGPTGNFIFRTAGVALFAFLLYGSNILSDLFSRLEDGVIWFHIAFNASIGFIGLFFIAPMANLMQKILPVHVKSTDVQLMTSDNLIDPMRALTLSRRELIKSVHILHSFWDTIDDFIVGNPTRSSYNELRHVKNIIGKRSVDIEKFLLKVLNLGLNNNQLLDWQRQRNENDELKTAADTMVILISALETHKLNAGVQFTEEGASELVEQQSRVLKNLETLGKLIGSEDPEKTKALKKELHRERKSLEKERSTLIERHLLRIAQAHKLAVKSHALHMELLTIFMRFNSIICGIEEY